MISLRPWISSSMLYSFANSVLSSVSRMSSSSFSIGLIISPKVTTLFSPSSSIPSSNSSPFSSISTNGLSRFSSVDSIGSESSFLGSRNCLNLSLIASRLKLELAICSLGFSKMSSRY